MAVRPLSNPLKERGFSPGAFARRTSGSCRFRYAIQDTWTSQRPGWPIHDDSLTVGMSGVPPKLTTKPCHPEEQSDEGPASAPAHAIAPQTWVPYLDSANRREQWPSGH